MTTIDYIAYYSIIPILFILGYKKINKNSYSRIFLTTGTFILILKIFLWNFNIYITQFIYWFLLLFTIQVLFEKKTPK